MTTSTSKPLAIGLKAAVISTLLALAAGGVAGYRMGGVAADQRDRADVQQAFKNGMAIGAICAHQPDLQACRPEELEQGGVL